MGKSPQQRADLRCCAACEWVFKRSEPGYGYSCPECGFGSYGAKSVYGHKAYSYAKTQEPWLNNKIFEFKRKLTEHIKSKQVCAGAPLSC